MIDIIYYLTSSSSLLQFRSETIVSYLFLFSMYLSMISAKLPERIRLHSKLFEKESTR